MMNGQRYFSYLLRVWLAGDRDQPHWRASLEDTHTGERRGFASLAALNEYLSQLTDPPKEPEQVTKEGRNS